MVLHALLLAAAALGSACTFASRPPNQASSQADPSVRITAAQFGSEITVRVGDVIVVERPADYDQWSVDFSLDVLRSLNTEEGRRRPPAAGWTFAVVARGTTDLAFTPIIPRGGAPNVPRFVITITAE